MEKKKKNEMHPKDRKQPWKVFSFLADFIDGSKCQKCHESSCASSSVQRSTYSFPS